MNLLLLIGAVLVLVFGFVVFFGAPYLPTFRRQTDVALELLDLQKGQTLLELGCGDGRVLRAAAEQGLHAVGYELNPVLVLVAKVVTWRYRKQVTVKWGNFWQGSWPDTDGIFVFLLDKYMEKLDKKIIQQYPKGMRLVSYAFKLPNKQPAAEKAGLFLYIYNSNN